VAVVALKAINLDKLIRQIITLIPAPKIDTNPQKERLNLLIFGPPNSGKSTLMNYLLKTDRSLATTIAGTTREPVISDWN
jgi:predicted GTPase